MGVVQKILSKAEVGEARGGVVEFELNKGGSIHIQNKTWRLEMREDEFIHFATACVEAGKKLKKLKGLDKNGKDTNN
jgi:hypothetical protein